MQFLTKDYTNVGSLADTDYICFCIEVDKGTIVKAIESGADTLKKIRAVTSACTGSDCKNVNPTKKCCSPQINMLIKQTKG
jgi:NAD(P)H-nitrite reductase large subunit